MMERRDEHDVLHLAATAVPALVRCRTVGVHLDGRAAGSRRRSIVPDGIRARVAGPAHRRCPPRGRSARRQRRAMGLGVPAAQPSRRPSATSSSPAERAPAAEMLLLRTLAQQTGIAIANARLHASKQDANAALAETVAALQRKTAIHDRFTQVALGGGGHDGIVRALHELTGLPAGIEDRAGNLLSWAGPGAVATAAPGHHHQAREARRPSRPRRPADPGRRTTVHRGAAPGRHRRRPAPRRPGRGGRASPRSWRWSTGPPCSPSSSRGCSAWPRPSCVWASTWSPTWSRAPTARAPTAGPRPSATTSAAPTASSS